MAIELTERAAKEVSVVIGEQLEKRKEDGDASEGQGLYLRVGVKGGGCSGFSYSLDVTETVSETDERWNMHGVEVVCDSKSYIYLNGVVIDFKDEMMGRGFVFNNPNATSSCGCGSSFTP